MLSIIENNYDIAIDILQNNYGNNEGVVHALYQNLNHLNLKYNNIKELN